ncbi:unnamed protein product [Discula destructiva]
MHCAASTGSRQPYTAPAPLTPDSLSSDAGPESRQCPSAMDDLGPHQQGQGQSQHHPQPLPSPSTPSGNVLTPTWRGMVMSTIDALKIIEACLSGVLLHTARRPHDREREHLIRSGNVFVYEESSSGIKRWTDGQNWSPSRILGNYLIYRELDKNFPPGDKKRAIKRKRDGKPELQNGSHNGTPGGPTCLNDERERALLGSLIDSYPFKEGGLIKKTISIKWNNVMHHLVSYYSLEDARNHRLPFPNDDPKLAHLRPRPELIQLQDFRVPVEQEDPRFLDDRALLLGMMPHGLPHGSYASTPNLERTLSLPHMANNMMPSPYGTSQYMSMQVGPPMGSSMQMSGFQGHSSGGYFPYEQQQSRSRAPSLHMPSFGSNMPPHHLMGSSSGKRRRSDAYDNTPTDTPDIFSPVGGHGHDHLRTSHGYFHGASTSYSMPSIPATSMSSEGSDFKPAVSNMGPPSASSTTSELASSSTHLAYAPSSLSSSSAEYSSATSAAQPSSLTSSTLDGQSRGGEPPFYPAFHNSLSSWGHNSDSYAPSSRSLNGWHTSSSGSQH